MLSAQWSCGERNCPMVTSPKSTTPTSLVNAGTVTSVARWLYYFSIFGHLQQWKFAKEPKFFAKVGFLT